ncbi:MAG: chemotaxis protein CheA, partial [Deltaproteobacteria bacterium]|nr:chemotaxis protein CheA [Deltaproteobacteria bacterium]
MSTNDQDEDLDVRDEFLAESQEIVEALSRDLLVLDQMQKEGTPDPDLINEIFRGVHTLKGIAGMFGYHQVGAVAHALEDLLDDLRLGRVALSQEVLDVLFEGVENFQRLLGDQAGVDLSQYAQSIERVSSPKEAPTTGLESYDLDPGVLAVLTEYEEHRLRTNVDQGNPLYRLKVRFNLASIDTALEELKSRAKPVAEIITYLPSMGEIERDAIDLDVLLASRAPEDELRELLARGDSELMAVPRRGGQATFVASPAPIISTPPPAIHGPSIPVSAAAARTIPPAAGTGQHDHAANGAASTDEGADPLSLRSVANTVRVDIRKLDHLMNVVGELAIVRSAMGVLTERLRVKPELRQLATELHRANRSFERSLEELQDGILDVRMVPLRQIFDKLARVVRQTAREHEKEIRLVLNGAETEVDKLIVEELSDPLMHIIRNSIDHGIEKPKMRELAGKSAEGTLALNAYQKGNNVLIEVEDDGAGISAEKIFETAVRRGLVSEEAREELSEEDIFDFIFTAGFTTRSAITDLSGRGVGMDVVKTNISRLGGVVDVASETGIGTKFTITLPITLAIISALIVKVAGRRFAIPLTAVEEALLLRREAIRTVEGRDVITLRGATLPLCRVDSLF